MRADPQYAASCLDMLHAVKMTFDVAESNFDWFKDILAYTWNFDAPFKVCHYSKQFWYETPMLCHFLLAPDQVDAEAFASWLPAPGRACCDRSEDATDASRYEIYIGNAFTGIGIDAEPHAYEALGRLAEATESASIIVERFPFNGVLNATCMMLRGRNEAAAGNTDAALAQFDTAAEHARGPRAHYVEMLAARDKLVHPPRVGQVTGGGRSAPWPEGIAVHLNLGQRWAWGRDWVQHSARIPRPRTKCASTAGHSRPSPVAPPI